MKEAGESSEKMCGTDTSVEPGENPRCGCQGKAQLPEAPYGSVLLNRRRELHFQIQLQACMYSSEMPIASLRSSDLQYVPSMPDLLWLPPRGS